MPSTHIDASPPPNQPPALDALAGSGVASWVVRAFAGVWALWWVPFLTWCFVVGSLLSGSAAVVIAGLSLGAVLKHAPRVVLYAKRLVISGLVACALASVYSSLIGEPSLLLQFREDDWGWVVWCLLPLVTLTLLGLIGGSLQATTRRALGRGGFALGCCLSALIVPLSVVLDLYRDWSAVLMLLGGLTLTLSPMIMTRSWLDLVARDPLSSTQRALGLCALVLCVSVELTDWPFRFVSFPLHRPWLEELGEFPPDETGLRVGLLRVTEVDCGNVYYCGSLEPADWGCEMFLANGTLVRSDSGFKCPDGESCRQLDEHWRWETNDYGSCP